MFLFMTTKTVRTMLLIFACCFVGTLLAVQPDIPDGFSATVYLSANVPMPPFSNNSILNVEFLFNNTIFSNPASGESIGLLPNVNTGWTSNATGCALMCYEEACCTAPNSAFSVVRQALRAAAPGNCMYPPSSSCGCNMFSPVQYWQSTAPFAQVCVQD
jgi:hypothetical protein